MFNSKIHVTSYINILLVTTTAVCMLGWYIHTIRPTTWLALLPFFGLTTTVTSLLIFTVTQNVRRALLWGTIPTAFLVLRLLYLREWYYATLCLLCYICLEFALKKR